MFGALVVTCGFLAVNAVENLALGKPTNQTDTLVQQTAEKAVDGRQDICTHTTSSTDAWWEVDVGKIYRIDHVIVVGRTDCCVERLRDVQLFIGYIRSEDDYVLRGFHKGIIPGQHTYQMTSPVYGRWVKITRASTVNGRYDFLTLCEVEVMGNEMWKATFEFGTGMIGTGTVQKSSQARTAAECCMQCMITSMCPAVNYNFGTEMCEQLETVTTIDDSNSDTYFYRLP